MRLPRLMPFACCLALQPASAQTNRETNVSEMPIAHSTANSWLDPAAPPALQHTLRGHGAWVRSLAFSPTDPTRLVTSGSRQRIKLWDVDRGVLIDTIVGHG